jgi:putative transposase
MPRHAYHVTFTVAERAAVFSDLRLGRVVARCINSPELMRDASTLAWVLMPDHLHWLVQLGDQLKLDQLVRRMKSASAQRVNQLRGASGSLWQPGYYDHLIRDDENLRDAARYIVANPLRAGLVKVLGDYPLWDAIWLSEDQG